MPSRTGPLDAASIDLAICRRMRGLLQLAEAAATADIDGVDRWQFAVPVGILRAEIGATLPDLRWLLNHGLAEVRIETARRGRRRTFRSGDRTSALRSAKAVFIASAEGLHRVCRLCEAESDAHVAGRPQWNRQSGELMFDGVLVKHLTEVATAQRTILDACEAADWAEAVENPFSGMPACERSHYLRRVLNHLNHGQRGVGIHFSTVAKGHRFRWSIANGAFVALSALGLTGAQ